MGQTLLDNAGTLEQPLGDWSGHPNKAYVGNIGQVMVSPAQAWPTEYYIDHYLQSRGRPVTHWNRNVVAAALGKFRGEPPFKCSELDQHLDGMWRFAGR